MGKGSDTVDFVSKSYVITSATFSGSHGLALMQRGRKPPDAEETRITGDHTGGRLLLYKCMTSCNTHISFFLYKIKMAP